MVPKLSIILLSTPQPTLFREFRPAGDWITTPLPVSGHPKPKRPPTHTKLGSPIQRPVRRPSSNLQQQTAGIPAPLTHGQRWRYRAQANGPTLQVRLEAHCPADCRAGGSVGPNWDRPINSNTPGASKECLSTHEYPTMPSRIRKIQSANLFEIASLADPTSHKQPPPFANISAE